MDQSPCRINNRAFDYDGNCQGDIDVLAMSEPQRMVQVSRDVNVHDAGPSLTVSGPSSVGEGHIFRTVGEGHLQPGEATRNQPLQASHPLAAQYPVADPGTGLPIQYVIVSGTQVPATRVQFLLGLQQLQIVLYLV